MVFVVRHQTYTVVSQILLFLHIILYIPLYLTRNRIFLSTLTSFRLDGIYPAERKMQFIEITAGLKISNKESIDQLVDYALGNHGENIRTRESLFLIADAREMHFLKRRAPQLSIGFLQCHGEEMKRKCTCARMYAT